MRQSREITPAIGFSSQPPLIATTHLAGQASSLVRGARMPLQAIALDDQQIQRSRLASHRGPGSESRSACCRRATERHTLFRTVCGSGQSASYRAEITGTTQRCLAVKSGWTHRRRWSPAGKCRCYAETSLRSGFTWGSRFTHRAKRRGWDSNPRHSFRHERHFQCRTFGLSVTSPNPRLFRLR